MAFKGFAVPTYAKMCILTSMIGFLFGYVLWKFKKAFPLPCWVLASSLGLTPPRYDTGSIGTVTTMSEFNVVMGDFSETIRGVIVSSSLITGAASASIAGILADRYGRIRISALGACIDGIGVAIECSSPVLGVFILGRLIKGIGAGLYLSTIYVQVSEMSPARFRGVLTSIPQFVIVVGLITGYFVCYGTSNIKNSSLSWRLPLAIASLAAFVLAVAVCFVPPSPRWFLTRGELDKARAVVQRLGFDQAEQDELLDQQQQDLQTEAAEALSLTDSIIHMFRNFREAFRQPYRSRTVFGCLIMAMQQFSGIDGVLYYAPLLFQKAGLKSTEASFLASGVSGLVIFAVTIPATLLADHWGRRTASILGGVLVSVLMLLMGALYAADQVHGAGRWVVIVCIYLFAIAFNGTWGIVFRIYLVESLPRKTRSSASSLAQSANWVKLLPSLLPFLCVCAAMLILPAGGQLHRGAGHACASFRVAERSIFLFWRHDCDLHRYRYSVHGRDKRSHLGGHRASIHGEGGDQRGEDLYWTKHSRNQQCRDQQS